MALHIFSLRQIAAWVYSECLFEPFLESLSHFIPRITKLHDRQSNIRVI